MSNTGRLHRRADHSPRARAGRGGRRRGAVLVYSVAAMIGFVGVCSLAVDWGRVQLAKTQLQSAADAAARAGARGLYDGSAARRAAECAAHNAADGSPVVLSTAGGDADVTLGRWDALNRRFVAGGYPHDAVKVTTRRTAARGNAVPLAFASLLGYASCDVETTAVASAVPDGYAIVGLDYIRMTGNALDAYWSSTGRTEVQYGNVASNGDITLQANTWIQGNARPGVGRQVIGADRVAGTVLPLTAPLVYPNGTAGRYVTDNDNGKVPSKFLRPDGSFRMTGSEHLPLPGGHYYFKDFEVGGSATIDFAGPATVYCYGSVKLAGGVRTSEARPKNLRIVMVPGPSGAAPGDVKVAGNAALYATIYAPQSPFTLVGTGDLYGSIVGKSIDMVGNGTIHYDLAIDPDNAAIKLLQ